MLSSPKKTTAPRAKFRACELRALPLAAILAQQPMHLDRRKDRCAAIGKNTKAWRASIVPARLESTTAAASALLDYAHDFLKTHRILQFVRSQVFNGGMKWFC